MEVNVTAIISYASPDTYLKTEKKKIKNLPRLETRKTIIDFVEHIKKMSNYMNYSEASKLYDEARVAADADTIYNIFTDRIYDICLVILITRHINIFF